MSDSVYATNNHTGASRRAGLVRVGFASTAVLFARTIFPEIGLGVWVLDLYLAFSLLAMVIIVRRYWAGDARSLVSGSIDALFLSYVVYELGIISNVLPFIYLLIPVLHASSSSSRSRVGNTLALLSVSGYAVLLVLTALGIVPYAPSRIDLDDYVPSLPMLAMSGALVILSVLVTTNLVSRQVVALGQMNAQLAELSQRDELTQLFNRRHLMQALAHELRRVRRGAQVGVMMIDLDGFKRVNDELGHGAGDRLLQAVAEALVDEMRALDLVARYGGDEFVVILPDADPEACRAVSERAVRRIADASRDVNADYVVTASIGVATAFEHDEVGTLLKRADEEAYRSKRAGGNRVTGPAAYEYERASGQG